MPGPLIRILSDVHFGDRASRVSQLSELRPLLEGVSHLVLNGDTLETRPGPYPAYTAQCRAEVLEFFPREVPGTTFLTGNHDADFSPVHHLDLAAGKVFAIHGDIFFDDIVPWARDAPVIGRQIAEELRLLPPDLQHQLDHRMAAFRKVAATIPQRHQSERHGLKYSVRYLADTIWPPWRILRVLRAWQSTPRIASEFSRRHRPAAKFIVSGHTHQPGVWQTKLGITVINTGAFCMPFGGYCVDLTANRLAVRKINVRTREFRPGPIIEEFPLAGE